jgi:hypothetical protein
VTANRILLPALLTLFSAALAASQTVPAAAPSALPTQVSAPAQTITPAGQQPAPAEHILQDGTPVKLSLLKELSSSNAETGQSIQFEVLNDLAVDGVTVLRRGTVVTGVVAEAQKRRRMGRAGVLNFTISQVTLADGTNVPVRAFNNTNGDSHAVGVTALALNMPVVAAPFFLLMHGENSTVPKGTETTIFTSGDTRLNLNAFNVPRPAGAAKDDVKPMAVPQ